MPLANAMASSSPAVLLPSLASPDEPAGLPLAPGPDTVYVRTLAGHNEVLAERCHLTPQARRLLRMFTGLTPLRLLAHPGSGIDDPLDAARALQNAGLIVAVGTAPFA